MSPDRNTFFDIDEEKRKRNWRWSRAIGVKN